MPSRLARVCIRLSLVRKQRIRAAATAAGLPVSKWVQRALSRRAAAPAFEPLDERKVAARTDLVRLDFRTQPPVRREVVATLRERVTRATKRGAAPHGTSRKRTG